MIVAQYGTTDPGPKPPPLRPVAIDQTQERRVQSALNLHLRLKSPVQARALKECIERHQTATFDALERLNYVHFARFLMAPDYSALWVITVYDGELEPYILDFVVALGDVFNEALQFMQDAPRLPVQQYPRDFIEFVNRHNQIATDWSAYPDLTVIDIQRQFGLA
jgi:hypothetical protein